jgi:nucleotide-binding universal stress UspA family protein
MRRIVVGVDGSPSSLEALRWAAGEARLRGATLVALHAWTLPPVSTANQGARLLASDFARIRDGARKLLELAVAEAVPDKEIDIARVVCEGPPAQALVASAEDADLLVVGSRGLGGFKGLLLGSVSREVAQHAPCPVVVVRTPVRDARRRGHIPAAGPKEVTVR